MLRIASVALVTAAIVGAPGKAAADPQVDRGKYLVTTIPASYFGGGGFGMEA